MLLYGWFKIDISGPLSQHLKTIPKFSCVMQKYSQYEPVAHGAIPKRAVSVSVALMQMRSREAGQGGGWVCGPEQLAATVPCALFTVDVYNGEAHTAFGRVL